MGCIEREIKMDTVTTCATLLFFTELYHILGHSVILFGIRSLPLRDLEKVGYYFAIDLLTVALSWCLTQEYTLLVGVQQVQHIYYVLNWNKSHMAKRGKPTCLLKLKMLNFSCILELTRLVCKRRKVK